MENTKEQAVKALNEAIETVEQYKEAVRNVVDEFEDAQEKDLEEVSELQDQITNLKAKQDGVADRSEAKALIKEITELENELELTKEINERLNKQRTDKIAGAVVELLKATKAGKQAYSKAEKTVGLHTTLSTVKDDVKYMKESGHKLNLSDSYAKSVLLDFKIIDNSVTRYAGHHLNSVGSHTHLTDLFDADALRDHKIFI